VIFLSCKVNARVFDAKSGHGPHSPPPGVAASPKRPSNVAFLRYATQPVWARNPDSQPTNVIPITKYRATLALVLSIISQGPQPDFKIVSVSVFPRYSLGICYWAQQCGQTQEWLTDS